MNCAHSDFGSLGSWGSRRHPTARGCSAAGYSAAGNLHSNQNDDYLEHDSRAQVTEQRRGKTKATREYQLEDEYRARVTDRQRNDGPAEMEDKLKRDLWARGTDQERGGSRAREEDHLEHVFRVEVTDQERDHGRAEKEGPPELVAPADAAWR